MRLRFMSLSSGSSGNCYYLALDEEAILIDAGIPSRQIREHLGKAGVSFETVRAVLVTHDHADHIKSLGALCKKYYLPVYATRRTHEGINNNYCMTEKLSAGCARYIEKEVPFEIGSFRVTAFEVPHDGTDNVGYLIEADERTFCFVTDLGHITDVAASYIVRADYLVMEANYDEDMLRMGHYAKFLKDRITSPLGHLSNKVTAEFIAANMTDHLRHIWLCHLSGENNHPDLAFKTVEYSLRGVGIIPGKDVGLTALKRTTPSELYEL